MSSYFSCSLLFFINKWYCIPLQYLIMLVKFDTIFSFTFQNFYFIPFISPSPVCFYNCRTVGSIRPTFPLISIFGQKLYTRCLFSWSSPGRRLLYYFPVFRTQFFISCRPNISYIKEHHAFLRWGRDQYSTFCNFFERFTVLCCQKFTLSFL